MAQFPALPLFTDAYLGDTTHLTTIEHGTYLLLLMAAWRSKDCKLPDDDKLLARYTKLSNAQWQRIKPIIIPFFTIENGFIFQLRLLDELDTVKRLTMQRSNAGKASALKRKNRQSTSVATKEQRDLAPTPTPTPIKKTKEKKGERITKEWCLQEDNISYAKEKGFMNGQIQDLGESFKDYWLADSTPKSHKKDWDAAFRTWVRNAVKFQGGNNDEIGDRIR
tara:strand:+ start:114 stop:779 length:666 start_codon:yes stop_codon:yes gene_type:complete